MVCLTKPCSFPSEPGRGRGWALPQATRNRANTVNNAIHGSVFVVRVGTVVDATGTLTGRE